MKNPFLFRQQAVLLVAIAVSFFAFNLNSFAIQNAKSLKSTLIINSIKEKFNRIATSNDIFAAETQSKIYQAVKQITVLKPSKKMRDDSTVDYEAEALKKAQERYSLNKQQITERAAKVANVKFKGASVGDTVTIYFTIGTKPYKLTGPLTSISDKGVTIGAKTIQLYDIDLNYQYLFDAKKRQSEKKSYIRTSVAKYELTKKLYAKSIIPKLKKADENLNLKNGYIWHNEHWTTAQNIVDYMIKIKKREMLISSVTKGPTIPEDERNNSKPKEYYKFLTTAIKYRKELSSKNYGVDAIAGYGNIVWNSSLESAYTLCAQKEFAQANITDKTSYKYYPTKNKGQFVTFYFIGDKMYKFVINREFKTYQSLHDYANKVFAFYGYPEIFPTQLEEPMVSRPANVSSALIEGKLSEKTDKKQYSWAGKKNSVEVSVRSSSKKFFINVLVKRPIEKTTKK